MKGSSISHYLIDFVNFVLYNQDMKTPHATLAVMIDFQKAFNRIEHNLIITILSDMGVPGWLLRIVIGFLRERELIVRFKGGAHPENHYQDAALKERDWACSYF